jgi:mono/diheme cytochrome c family protein
MPRTSRRFLSGILVGAIGMALCGLGVAAAIFRDGFTADARRTRSETAIANSVYQISIPSHWRKMSNPMPATPGNLAAGMEHFADHCAVCHANNGSGDTMFGRGLSPQPPDLRLAATQGKSDGELYYSIEHGIRMTGMPAFGNPGEGHNHGSWNLVLFIRHLPSLSASEELQMRGMNPISPAELREQQSEDEFLNEESNSKGEKP